MNAELPQGWEWRTLEDLAAPEPRSITDGPFGSNLKTAHYTESGPRVIRLQNVGDGEYRHEDAHISEEHYEALRRHSVQAGDLVVASLGETLPRACLVPASVPPAIVKADCIRVRLGSHVDARYVNYALQRPTLREETATKIKGVGRPRLGMTGIKALTIPVAPIAEQRRIVAAIEEHVSRLEAAEASVRLAQQKAVALERAILQRADDAMWECVELGSLLDDIEAGKSLKAPGRPAEDTEWGVIKVSAMTWGFFDERENKAVLDQAGVQERFEIEEGDLLFSRANTSELVGAAVLVERTRPKLLLSDKSMRLHPKASVDRRWLRYCLGAPSVRDQISALATGTSDSMRNISQAKVRKLRVHLPPEDEQARLAAEIREQRDQRQRLERSLRSSRARAAVLRGLVLSAAFSGQLVAQQLSDEPMQQPVKESRRNVS